MWVHAVRFNHPPKNMRFNFYLASSNPKLEAMVEIIPPVAMYVVSTGLGDQLGINSIS